jgi:6-phosphogluconolactonase (cycloisomerase 2 family)
MYTVDSCFGSLTPTAQATVPTGANAFGSEEMVVDPAGRFAYVANLMSNATDLATVSMYTINSGTRVLTPDNASHRPNWIFFRKESGLILRVSSSTRRIATTTRFQCSPSTQAPGS